MGDDVDQNTNGDELQWRDGVPVSSRFDDPYYSLEDGLAETCHVFLDGNDLPARFRPGFHIAELGFGTGLNVLAAWEAWERSEIEGPLRVTSFEAFPMVPDAMTKALTPFQPLLPKVQDLVSALAEGPEVRLDGLRLSVVIGDARQTVPRWSGMADAWFLDGFAPARNPELWEPELLNAVAKRLASGGTLATYTAAGDVRRALEAAGLTVQRRPGFGRKRHMTVAQRP